MSSCFNISLVSSLISPLLMFFVVEVNNGFQLLVVVNTGSPTILTSQRHLSSLTRFV